jgi:PKD repeat protein
MKFKCIVLLLVIFSLAGHRSFAQVATDFTVNKSSGCVPLTGVQFTANCTPSDNVTYSWDLGNGNTSTVQNPAATYSASGNYTVTLTATRNGQSSSKSMVIRVFKNPVADFSTVDNITKACVPLTVRFSDLSTVGDTTLKSWLWQYGTGAYDTLRQKNFVYNYEGLYTVVLTVTDNHGCTNTVTKNNFVDVAKPPQVSFHADPIYTCSAPAIINFIDGSTVKGTPSYQWIMGSSASSLQNASFTLSKYDTTYTIKLTVTDLTYNTINNCTGQNQLDYQIQRVKAVGTVMQGTNIISQTGATVCAGEVDLHSHSLPSNGLCLWVIDNNAYSTYDSTAQYIFNSAGSHTISLISSPGSNCADTLIWNFTVEKVVPDFTESPDISCQQSASVSFTNISSVNAASFFWKFGDGSTSTSKSPSPVTYSVGKDANSYVVHEAVLFPTKLIATTIFGCQDSITHSFVIKRPTALFSVDSIGGCAPLSVVFTDASQSDSAIIYHDWDMGNGTVLHKTTETTASYTYTTPGTYNTKLWITNKNNCIDTSYAVPIKVGSLPGANFSVSPATVCQSDVVSITDLTPGTPDYWLYTVNGISIASCSGIKSPTFRSKPDIGVLTISQVVGSNGCYAQSTKTITNNGPVASFTYDIANCTNPYNYQFTSTYKGSPLATFKWDFGDGTPASTLQSPAHTFPASPENKDYIVTFVVFDNSCSDTAVQIVRVRKSIASFTGPTWACAFQAVAFHGSASQPMSELCGDKYAWNFNDTTPIIRTDVDTIQHTFKYSGNYKVLLSALHDNGCVDTVSQYIRIYRPKAGVATDKVGGCPGTQIKFTDTSKPDSNPISKLYLNFGDMTKDSSTVAGSSFNHIYMDQGLFTPYLKVIDSKGCYDSTSVFIGIEQPIVSLISSEVPPQTCVNKTITFTQTALEVDSMRWDFGDGTPIDKSNVLSIDHVYTQEGSFNAKIKVFKYGCSDSIALLVQTQKADASFTVTDSVLYCPKSITFRHLYPSSNIVSGEWDTGNKKYPYDTTQHTIIYTYPNPGTYTAQLSITTSFGCTDFKTKTIKILSPGATFTLSTRQSCKKTPITFTMGDTVNIGTFEWDFGDGTVDNSGLYPVTTHQYAEGGKKHVFLNINNPSGQCPKSLPDSITIDSLSAKFSVKDTAGCDQIPVTFTNLSTGNTSQLWNFSDGPVSTEVSPEHTYSLTGPFPVSLVVYSLNSCTDTAKRTMTITKTPGITVSITSCANKKAQLHATGGNYVNWWPKQGLSDSTSYDPIATPPGTMYYKARVTNIAGGCTKTDSILIIRPMATVTPTLDTLFVGQTVQIHATDTSSVKTFYWSPSTNLDTTDRLNPIASPVQTTAYYLILDDPNNCFTDSIRVDLILKYGKLDFVAPTAFKPGDVDNGIFRIRTQGYMELLEFKIYNRWGNVVFSSNEGMVETPVGTDGKSGGGFSSKEGWDGTYQGNDQPIDTYIWVATARMFSDKGVVIVKKKGTVILLR